MALINRLEAGGDDTLRIPDPPKLAPLVDTMGFKDGIAKFDEDMTRWCQDMLRQVSDTFELKKK